MGIVYLAEDLNLTRKTAIKFLAKEFTSDNDLLARFEQEAKLTASLNHPNIVTIYEMGKHENSFYLAMEYIEGKTLHEIIQEDELQTSQVIDRAIQICEGLSRAHRAGIIHRDIKPANIMVKKDGLVKILDFGLAKLRGGKKLTKTSTLMGTFPYLSPEQIRGNGIDQRSDIFSLGVVLYELLTIKLPFRGDSDEAIMYSIIHEHPEPLARYKKGVSDSLQRIIDKALDKDVETRYQSVDELLSDLKREGKTYLLRPESTKTYINKLSLAKKIRLSKYLIPMVLILIITIYGMKFFFLNGRVANTNFFNDEQIQVSLPAVTPIISDLVKISDANLLKEELAKYNQEMRLGVGNKRDFANPEGSYVFVVDATEVVGVFLFQNQSFYDINSKEKLSSLSEKFEGLQAVWVQDYTDLNTPPNTTEKVPEEDVEPSQKSGLYEQYRNEGDDLFAQENFKQAKVKYQLALGRRSEDSYVANKLKQCDTKIAEAEQQRLYTKFKNQGDTLFNQEEYKEAKNSYVQALTYRPGDKTIEQQIILVESRVLYRDLRRTPVERLSSGKVHTMIKEYDFYAPEGYPWSNPLGKGVVNNFSLQENGQVVLDRATGLLWQQSGSEDVTYSTAHDYIKGLNLKNFSGHNEWKLPTLEEAMTLMEPEGKNNNLHIDSIFDSKQHALWTADKLDVGFAWIVDFTTSRCYITGVKDDPVVAERKFVRAVR